MKVIFDTNIYINWIRKKEYFELMVNTNSIKYLSGIVLMELWAGAKTRQSARIIDKIQAPYIKAKRIICLSQQDYINAGQMISDLPENLKDKINSSSFLNDLFIALNSISIGATLYTENSEDFSLIKTYLPKLKFNGVA
ncbi:MAG: type II toxin-antitoxin system VapC family toxin [archaeon]|nr:type II toxin-antitoxin system VapC family toxin [archaeon]